MTNNPIELVALIDDQIVGIIEAEYETKNGEIFDYTEVTNSVIWTIAVLPEYRNQGIGTKLLNEVYGILINNNIPSVTLWTRDQNHVNLFFINHGFNLVNTYLEVYYESLEMIRPMPFKSNVPNLHIYSVFCNYTGNDHEKIKILLIVL